MKTIILFIIGLLGWLLLTNYQLVYSKVVNFTNPVDEVAEVVTKVGTSPDATTEMQEKELSSTNNAIAKNKVNSSESELIEKTADTSAETANKDATSLADNNEITKESDETLEAAKDELKIDLVNETESILDSNEEAEQVPNSVASNSANANEALKKQPWMQPNSAKPMYPYNMMNPAQMNHAMMNPGMFMNPMAMMTPMMMGMMAPMMNPAMMMNPNALMSHPINSMTHPQNMNAMMMSMDPKMMFSMFGQPSKEYLEGEVPDQLPVVTIPGMPTQTFQNWPINKVSPGVSREAKKNAFQTAMAMSPLSMRDMMGIMAEKIPVDEGVSWDDAVEAMKLRANEVNFKFVGSSPLWKEIEAVTGNPSAKVEMFRFCDAKVARNILDAVPEFIVFLPCKIALLEDGEGKLWVMTMDWDVNWLDYSQNPNSHLSKQIREDAQHIRDNLHYIMEGAATGDF